MVKAKFWSIKNLERSLKGFLTSLVSAVLLAPIVWVVMKLTNEGMISLGIFAGLLYLLAYWNIWGYLVKLWWKWK